MILILLLTTFAIPSAVLASAQQTVNEEDDANADIPGDLIPTGPTGPVGIVNELQKAHSNLSGIMDEHSGGSYEHDYPFTMAYVDPDREELVVAMHPLAAFVGIEYDESEIQQVLGTAVPLKIIYAEFIPEATQTQQDYYERYCTPDIAPGYLAVCKAYAKILINGGIEPADLGPYTIFIDTFDNMRNWDLDGDDIDDDDLGSGYGVIPGHTTRNDVATNDDDCDTCVMELDDNIDLSGYDSAALSFWKLVDDGFESGDYLKVETTHDGSSWTQQFKWTTGDDQWQKHTLSIPTTSTTDFNVRFTAQIADDDNKFGIDNVIVKVENNAEGEESVQPPSDTTPPVITVPDDIAGTPRVASLGYYAEFTVTATDDTDGTVDVTCSHDSGYFQIGVTTVECSATDNAGNAASASFTITVTSGTPADSDGDGYHDGIDQCPNEASDSNYGCPEEESSMSIYAGQEHEYTYEHLIGDQPHMHNGGSYGTIGFTGTDMNGQIGFVGAGHTFQPEVNFDGTSHIVQKHFHKYENVTVSNVTAVSPFGRHGSGNYNLDAGWVPLDTTKAQITNQIKRLDGQVWSMTQANSADAQRGAKIDLSGAKTNSNGVLLFKNATIITHNHKNELVTMEGHYLGNYNSIRGDSGAPVTINATNPTPSPSVKLIGIHTGTICRYSSPSEGNDEVNVYSIFNGTDPYGEFENGYQVCGYGAQRLASLPNSNISSLSWYYKAIVPWDLIKNEFSIR